MNHISSVKDGAIVLLNGSARYWMKVCQRSTGLGGVVDIVKGEYIPIKELDKYGFGLAADVIADSLEEFITRE